MTYKMLNVDQFYYLDNIKELRTSSVWLQHLCVFVDSDYYYYEFKDGTAFLRFPIEELIPINDLQRIKNKEIKLIINNSHESFHHIIPDIYEALIVKSKLPPEQIIFMSESASILHEIKKYSTLYNVADMKCVWTRIMEFDIQSTKKVMMASYLGGPRTLQNKIYIKKFINFNRRWRLHRPVLVGLLYATKLINEGYVSLALSDDNRSWETVWPSMLQYHANTPSIISLLKNNENEILNLPGLYIDTDELINNRAEFVNSTNYLYEDTYFSVVSETNYYTSNVGETGHPTMSYHGGGVHLTEKTFKTIVNMHPAILVSPPHSLIKLRELGYKTFSPWIDESYDLELNDSERMLKILAEIKRLCELTPTELSEFLINLRPICKFNKHVLLTQTMFSTSLN